MLRSRSRRLIAVLVCLATLATVLAVSAQAQWGFAGGRAGSAFRGALLTRGAFGGFSRSMMGRTFRGRSFGTTFRGAGGRLRFTPRTGGTRGLRPASGFGRAPKSRVKFASRWGKSPARTTTGRAPRARVSGLSSRTRPPARASRPRISASRPRVQTRTTRGVTRRPGSGTPQKAGSSHHGNSKASNKPQHIYAIFDRQTGKVHKFGISGSKLTSRGFSPRAARQVANLNKKFGQGFKGKNGMPRDRFVQRVVGKDIRGSGTMTARQSAISAEKMLKTQLVQKHGSVHGMRLPRWGANTFSKRTPRLVH